MERIPPRARGRVRDAVAGPDRDAHWLLDQRVQAGLERFRGDCVVRLGSGNDVDRGQVGHGGRRFQHGGERPRPGADVPLGLLGGSLGTVPGGIDHGHQLGGVRSRPCELGEPVDVAQAHAAAAGKGELDGHRAPGIRSCEVDA